MRCKTCRYSLKGLAEHRCPECGREFDPIDPASYESDSLRRPFESHALIAVAALGLIFLYLPNLGGSQRGPPPYSKTLLVWTPLFLFLAIGFGVSLSGIRSGHGSNRWLSIVLLGIHALLIAGAVYSFIAGQV